MSELKHGGPRALLQAVDDYFFAGSPPRELAKKALASAHLWEADIDRWAEAKKRCPKPDEHEAWDMGAMMTFCEWMIQS